MEDFKNIMGALLILFAFAMVPFLFGYLILDMPAEQVIDQMGYED